MAAFMDGLRRLIRSPGFKFFLVGALILLLGIPLALIWFTVEERESRAQNVRSEIAGTWGGPQKLSGPYLLVPYNVKILTKENDKDIERREERLAVFLPDSVNITGDAKTQILKRSIYEVTVYDGTLHLEGRFASPDVRLADKDVATVHWQEAVIALTLSDVSGLKEAATFVINGNKKIPFEPGVGLSNSSYSGINVRPFTNARSEVPEAFSFSTDLAFKGSSSINFDPVGRETKISFKSGWPHPSFGGAFSPESRNVHANGFDANWRVPHLARSVPQIWAISGVSDREVFSRFSNQSFGVNFFVPVDYYDLVNRATKYGLMFLAVAFLGVFVLELTSGKAVHPVQYIFVGLAMILFYVLLLSLSEHIGFTIAYVVAAAATGGMLSLYVGNVLCDWRRGLIMLLVFLILYSLLYLILRLQDYALLAGAVASFVMLTITMFTTLRVKWSGEPVSSDARQQAG
jgi:inner membrane protein